MVRTGLSICVNGGGLGKWVTMQRWCMAISSTLPTPRSLSIPDTQHTPRKSCSASNGRGHRLREYPRRKVGDNQILYRSRRTSEMIVILARLLFVMMRHAFWTMPRLTPNQPPRSQRRGKRRECGCNQDVRARQCRRTSRRQKMEAIIPLERGRRARRPPRRARLDARTRWLEALIDRNR